MFKIKEFATLCGCSVYTLRYYDEIDLLKPIRISGDSGYRYYSEEQIYRFAEIKELQEIGFSVQEIKMMEGCDNEEIAEKILKKVDYLIERLDKSMIILKKYLNKDGGSK